MLNINIIMTSLVVAMDNVNNTTKQYTENGNKAYGWNEYDDNKNKKYIRERIVQFYFQCVLGSELNNKEMQEKYEEMLFHTKNTSYFKYVIKLALQTRDVDEGKGMNTLSYYMLQSIFYCISTLNEDKYYKIYDNIVEKWLQEFKYDEKTQMPYGSWKDMKKYLNILLNSDHIMYSYMNKWDIIVDHVDKFYVKNMVKDRKNMGINQPISLLGKWLPRESSNEYKWLAKLVAERYYNHVYGFINVKKSSIMKTYRKLCSSFNKYLDVTQVHMCHRTWNKINFDNVTALTLYKNKNSFLNKKEIQEEHREICKQTFENFIEEKIKNNKSIKGKTLFPHQLVKDILYSVEELDENNIDIINLQWKGLVEHVKKNSIDNYLNNCIACIDVSPSMYYSNIMPLISAIGMGLLTMECSNIQRAFTFSETPEWVQVNNNMTFYEKVNEIKNTKWGATTNIYAMFEKLLHVCLENNVSDEEMKKYSLFIFSDMQFNECCSENEYNIIETVKNLYKRHNYNNIPYLIFWNLRNTDNFPTINKTPHSTKLSGNSASLFKFFINTDLESIKKMTNWTIIKEILNNIRYNIE